MALFTFRKLAATLVTASGGYAGAIVLCNFDPELKKSIERHIPGVDFGLNVLRAGANKLQRLLDLGIAQLPAQKEKSLTTGIHVGSLERIGKSRDSRRPLEAELPALNSVTHERQVEVIRLELEKELLSEVTTFIYNENDKLLEHQIAILRELAEIETQLSALVLKMEQSKSSSASLVLAQCMKEFGSKADIQNLDDVVRVAERARDLAKDEFIEGLSQVVIGSCRHFAPSKKVNLTLMAQSLWMDWTDAQPLIQLFQDDKWSWFSRIIPGPLHHLFSATEDTVNQRKIIAASIELADNNVLEAVKRLNGVSGWPRIVLKETLARLRILAELQQGLSVMSAYLTAKAL